MAAIRFFILLVLLGGLTVLLVQNWTPVLPLVFLGGQTKALPLSIWILFSVAAGVITSLFIAICFQVSGYFAQHRIKKQRRRAAKTASTRATTENQKTPEPPRTSSYSYAAATTPPRQTQTSVQDDSDGWDTPASDDWDFTEDTEPSDRDRREYSDRRTADRTRNDDWDDAAEREPRSRPQEPVKSYASDKTDDETNNEPRSSDRADSAYSYSSREPKNSGVGRTESVYDAQYRVLTPPYKQQSPSPPPPPVNNRPQNNDNDDWGFMEDEDWIEDEGDSPRPAK